MKRNSILTVAIIMIALFLLACSSTTESTDPPPNTAIPTQVMDCPPIIPGTVPEARGAHSMAYDSESKQMIMFGGTAGDPSIQENKKTDTWAFDPVTYQWKQMSPCPHPQEIAGDMTYNSKADRIILVFPSDPESPGSWDFTLTQTWAYDFNTDTWSRLADVPGGRIGARIVYDSESDKVILFGGFTLKYNIYYDDTWAYDYNSNTWTLMQSGSFPQGQNYQCMAYDPKADRIVNWGGDNANLWTYDYNTDTWKQQMPNKISPTASYYCGFTYDEKAELFILYGGSDVGSDETWTYDLASNTWQKLEPPQNPGGLSRHTLVYDPVTDRTILFGGQIGGAQFSYSEEIWVFDLNTNTWTNITPEQ